MSITTTTDTLEQLEHKTTLDLSSSRLAITRKCGQDNIKPRVICLEGTDGSGKTTQSILLKHCLGVNGINAIYTREPGGGIPEQEQLREYLFAAKQYEEHQKTSTADFKPVITKTVEGLFYTFDRYQHLKRVIAPALAAGSWVVLDRYLLSTLVYQGAKDKTLVNHILDWHALINFNCLPDLTLLLVASNDTILSRLQTKAEITKNYFDEPSRALQNAELYQTFYKDYHNKLSSPHIHNMPGCEKGAAPNKASASSSSVKQLPSSMRRIEGSRSNEYAPNLLLSLQAEGGCLLVHQRLVAKLNSSLGLSLEPLTEQFLRDNQIAGVYL